MLQEDPAAPGKEPNLEKGESPLVLVDYRHERRFAEYTRLREEGTPFFYLSGHASFDPDSGAPEAPMLPKPVSLDALREALSTLADAR